MARCAFNLIVAVAATLTVLASGVASAQSQPRRAQPKPPVRGPAAIAVREATLLTNGYAQLAEGLFERAAATAATLIAAQPRSGAALHLWLEAEIALRGALPALDQYERWIGQRTGEEPSAVRLIAMALLREATAVPSDPAAQLEASRALSAEGERGARPAPESGTGAQVGTPTRARASLGDETAVDALIAELATTQSNPYKTIEALGRSGNPKAIGALTPWLQDARQEVRGAAADALGQLGDPQTAAIIRPLLSDRSSHVRVKAAGALLRLDDASGMPVLQQLMASQTPAERLQVAEAMAHRPDAGWMELVMGLSREPDPEIQAAAGRLLGPHHPEMARAILEPLLRDENPAIRQLASQGLGEALANDLTGLRRVMRDAALITRVRASARVLSLTR